MHLMLRIFYSSHLNNYTNKLLYFVFVGVNSLTSYFYRLEICLICYLFIYRFIKYLSKYSRELFSSLRGSGNPNSVTKDWTGSVFFSLKLVHCVKSVQIRTRKNSVFGYFSRSYWHLWFSLSDMASSSLASKYSLYNCSFQRLRVPYRVIEVL